MKVSMLSGDVVYSLRIQSNPFKRLSIDGHNPATIMHRLDIDQQTCPLWNKIYVIVTSGGDPVIASTGILVEANTRRFVVDEKKEIYYRAEVQNRVYKRELVELDQEICRLEQLLELPMEDYPKLTDDLLYLLPESKVDGTSAFQCRRKTDLESCNSISDGGEGVSYDKEEIKDVLKEMGLGQDALGQGLDQGQPRPYTHPPFGKRYSAQDHVPTSAFKKLRRLSRSLSIGHSSHFKWKVKKSGIPGKLDNHHWLSGCSGSKDSVAGDSDDVSLCFSSPPLSPSDFEKDTDKSRFAALLREELVSGNNIELFLGRGGVNLLDDVDRRRARLSSASSDSDHVPSSDKVTQTSFSDSPMASKKRFGHVFRVDNLEVIEMEDNPSGFTGQGTSDCHVTLNNQSEPLTERAESLDVAGDTVDQNVFTFGANNEEEEFLMKHARGEEKSCNLSRPESFPDKLGSGVQGSTPPGLRSPCVRGKGVAVRFSPYNEIRFLEKTNISDAFFQEAVDPSTSAQQHGKKSPQSASVHSSSPVTQLHQSTPCHVISDTQSKPSTELTSPGSVGDSASGMLESGSSKNPARLRFKNPQAVIENERRKRIRKLQHDLQHIQRELQDLDDLEYDVTEV